MQPAYPGDGFLLAGFANGPVAKSVHYRLVEFTPDGSNPLTAAFVGMENGAGIRRVRVATPQDLLAGPNGDELLLARAAWLPGVAGRTFSIVTNWKRLDRTMMPPVLAGPAYGDVPGAPWDVELLLRPRLLRAGQRRSPAHHRSSRSGTSATAPRAPPPA